MQVYFERREEIAPGIWQYYFTSDGTFDFVPGQYVSLYLAGSVDNERGVSRTFSLTSLPDEPSLSFVTKHFGLQTPYKHALQRLKPNDSGRIGDAMGDLVLPKSKEISLVFIAGGIGLASYVSMLKYLLHKREERAIYLFYHLRSAREMIFKELIKAYPLSEHDIAIEPNRISVAHVLSSVPPSSLFYLSGSQRFVEELLTGLESSGIRRSHIVFDYFDGYADL